MAESEDVTMKAKRIIAQCLKVTEDEIADNTNLSRDIGMDSLAGVEIIMDLEEAFKIEMPDTEAERLVKFKQIVDYIQKKLEQKNKK